MSFFDRVNPFKQKETHLDQQHQLGEQSGVLPKSGAYGIEFRFLLGKTPDDLMIKQASYNSKNSFAPHELVIVTITDLHQNSITVYGSVIKSQKKQGYEVLTAHPNQLALGEAGYIHTLLPSKIGKIPSSQSEHCYTLELEFRNNS
jgi:hypothetical protein